MRRLSVVASFGVLVAIHGGAVAQSFWPSGSRSSLPGSPTTRIFLSANGRYQLTLEPKTIPATPADTIEAVGSIAKVNGEKRSPMWSTTLKSHPLQFLMDFDVTVSDAGDCFVMSWRDVEIHKAGGVVWKGRNRLGYTPHKPMFPSMPENLIAIDEAAGERVVRYWIRDEDAWRAIRVSDGEGITVPAELGARWNEATRLEIREKLFRARREALTRHVGNMSKPLAKVAQAALATAKQGDLREIHYDFLTLRRNPEDRAFIEALLTTGVAARPGTPGFRRGTSDRGDLYFFEQTVYERLYGDWMLGIWDKKISNATLHVNTREAATARFALGSVSGTVRFSTPITFFRKPSGRLSIRLIPSASQKGAAPEILDVQLWIAPKDDIDLRDEITFAFTTVIPGTYRAKAVWDKRRPFEGGDAAGPGDYESALSAAFTVTAGGSVSNLLILCTNRVAGGAAYYAADDLATRQWKVTGELSRYTFSPDPDGRLDLFSAPAARWIVATNIDAATNIAQIAVITLNTAARVPNSRLPRMPELTVLMRKDERGGRLVEASEMKIVDEHGCVFEATHRNSNERMAFFRFANFPRAAAAFRIVGARGRYGSAADIFDYTVTNLVRTNAVSAAPLALPASLNLGSVQMSVSSVTGNYWEAWLGASFFEGLIPQFNWTVQEAVFADSCGNIMDRAEMCQAEKNVRVVGRAERSGSSPSVSSPFEFTIVRTPAASVLK